MHPGNRARLFDDFTGYDFAADRWNTAYTLGASSDAYVTQEGDADDLGGTLFVIAGASSGNYQQVDGQDTNPYRRAKGVRFEARFRLRESSSIDMVIGLCADNADNKFGIRAASANGDFRSYSIVGGVQQVNDAFPTPVALDLDWHTVELVASGAGGTVAAYFDGVLVDTIADADLPAGDLVPFVYVKTLTGATRACYVDFVAVSQPRAWAARYVGDIADSAIGCVAEGGDAILVGMDASGTDAGEVWTIDADYAATSLGKATSATECTALAELNGGIYAAFDNPDVYKWAGGTSWTAQSLSKDVIDFAKLGDVLYAGTAEASGRATVQRFDEPGWTDVGDTGWTNEANTGVRLAVHAGKLYAYYLSDNNVYEYSGTPGTWTDCGTPGGVPTGSLARQRSIFSFKGALYAVGGADGTIYKWGGGTSWTAAWAAADALQRPIVANGQIYALDRDTGTGEITIYASPDGARWAAVDSFTPATNADVATARALGAAVAGLTSTDALIWEVR
jgi:hypothetical protein